MEIHNVKPDISHGAFAPHLATNSSSASAAVNSYPTHEQPGAASKLPFEEGATVSGESVQTERLREIAQRHSQVNQLLRTATEQLRHLNAVIAAQSSFI